jgi:hypothetical protein
VLASGCPQSQQITCDSSEPVDDIEQTITAGNSSLSYDASTHTWKTDRLGRTPVASSICG